MISSIVKDPGLRLEASSLRNDLLDTRYLTSLLSNSPSFREHLGLEFDIKRRKCCEQAPQACICRDNLETYSAHLATRINSIVDHQMRHATMEEKTQVLACRQCCCTLYPFQPDLPKHKQALQTISFIWKHPERCPDPLNLDMIVCRACRLLWDLCDQDRRMYNAAASMYFRGYGQAFLDPQRKDDLDSSMTASYNDSSNSSIKRRDHFKPTYTESIMEIESVSTGVAGFACPLGLLKGVWMLQLGFVAYPRFDFQKSDPIQDHKDIENAYVWIQGRGFQHVQEPTVFTKCEHHSITPVICTQMELKDIPLETRLQWPSYYLKHPGRYHVFLIPLAWTNQTLPFCLPSVCARHTSSDLTSENFIWTTKFLALVEQAWDRAALLEWLYKTSFPAELTIPHIPIAAFIESRFDRHVPVKAAKLSAEELETKQKHTADIHQKLVQEHALTMPDEWPEIASRISLDPIRMQDVFDALHDLHKDIHACEHLTSEVRKVKQELKQRQQELKSKEVTLKEKESMMMNEYIPLFTSSIQGRDFLEHLGLKVYLSQHRVQSSKFHLLSPHDQLKVLKTLLPDASNDALLDCVSNLNHPGQLNMVHEPVIKHRLHLYPQGQRAHHSRKQLEEGPSSDLKDYPQMSGVERLEKEVEEVRAQLTLLQAQELGSTWEEDADWADFNPSDH